MRTQLGTKSSSRVTSPSSFAFAQPVTAAQEVTVKDGEEGLASLVCRDVDVPADVWDAHAAWYRHAAMESISEGYLEAVPRRSIFYLPVLSPYHPVAAVWTFFMLLVDLVYTAFWVPIGVAFCTESFGDIHSGCTQADLVGGCIYFTNVIMGFQCGMVLRHNYKRTKVVDGVRVALYYARYGRFWLDLLAVVPFIYLIVILCLPDASDASSTSWVGILSLVRLVRLLRLVSLSKVVVSNTLSGRYQDMVARHINVTTMYTLLLVYCLAVIINLESCIMLLIAYLEGVDQSFLTSVSWEDFTTVSKPYQWYASVYWVVTTSTTTGYGDFAAHSTVEQVFANLYMIAGMVMFGLLVGTIANALTRASASAAQLYRFRKKMSSIGRWLVQHSIPERTQKQVKDYFSDVWVSRDQTSLDTEIFNDLPTSLRNKVAQYITMDVVIRVHLFRDQEDGLQQLVAAALRPVDVIQGHDICRQGEEGDRLWICSEGELQALQHQAEPSYPRTPCLLGESVLLGDELASFRLRPWTLRASRGLVKLWELKLSDLWPIVRMYPRLKEDLLLYIRMRLLQELGFSQKGSIVEKSWCESVESISAALLKQSASVVETAAQELQAAQLEDGSLVCLLDGLLEFSTIRTKRVTLLQPGQLEGKQSSIDGSNADMPMGPGGQQGSIVSSHAPSLLVQSRSMRRGTHATGGELVLSPTTSMAQVLPVAVQGSGHAVLMAACGSCGRAVCGSCRQVVRGGGMVAGAGASTGVSPFITSAPSAASMPDGVARHQSKLLASMGLQSAARGGWRPVSRVSQRPGAARTGVNTMSMAASRSTLTAMSIPTENFGAGYGLWG